MSLLMRLIAMSLKAEITVAGDTREVEIDQMTRAELELASIQGNKIAEEELKERKRRL